MKLNVGIIGFGMIGKVHAYCYDTLSYFVDPPPLEARITHVVTARTETAEKAKRITGADFASTDYRTITENPDVDIVHICTPNGEHLPQLLSAIENRKHIYCDKPLVATLEEAERIGEAMRKFKYDRTNQITFHMRFIPAVRRAKQLIDSGALGRILQFRAAFLHSSNVDPGTPFKWKHGDAGGVLLDTGSHTLDLIDHLIGPFEMLIADSVIAVPVRPKSPGSKQMEHVTVEDSITMLARLRCGAIGTLEATKLASGIEDEFRFEIHGDRGAVRFNLIDPHVVEFFDACASDRPLGGTSGWLRINSGARFTAPDTDFPSPKSISGWNRAHAASLSNFLQAVAAQKPACPDFGQGIRVQKLMDAAARSIREKHWVNVDNH